MSDSEVVGVRKTTRALSILAGVLLVFGPMWPASWALSKVQFSTWYSMPAHLTLCLLCITLAVFGVYLFAYGVDPPEGRG